MVDWTLPFVELPDWVTAEPAYGLEQQIERYVAIRKANEKTWTWNDIGPGLTQGERDQIRDQAAARGLVPTIPLSGFSAEDRQALQDAVNRGDLDAMPAEPSDLPDFSGHVLTEGTLPPELWDAKDSVQFAELNKQFGGVQPPGYTWHHHQQPGRMQLVAFGVHNATGHSGGRDLWCEGDR